VLLPAWQHGSIGMLSVKILPFSKRLYSADADVTLIAPNFQGVVHHRFRFSSPPVWVSPCRNREVESKKKAGPGIRRFQVGKAGTGRRPCRRRHVASHLSTQWSRVLTVARDAAAVAQPRLA
jgi:hypothetical protein